VHSSLPADRKLKALFALPLQPCPPQRPRRTPGSGVSLSAPRLPRQSGLQQGIAQCSALWTGAVAWGRVGPLGGYRGRASRQAVLEGWGTRQRFTRRQRRELLQGYPERRCLASRRWLSRSKCHGRAFYGSIISRSRVRIFYDLGLTITRSGASALTPVSHCGFPAARSRDLLPVTPRQACPVAPAILRPACCQPGALPAARRGVGEASGGLSTPERIYLKRL
jgi:hypothetical protein